MNLKRLMKVKDGFDYGINDLEIKIGKITSADNVGSFLVTRLFKDGEVITIGKFLGRIENLKRQFKKDVGDIYVMEDFELYNVYFDSVYDRELAHIRIILLDEVPSYRSFITSLSWALSDICESYRK